MIVQQTSDSKKLDEILSKGWVVALSKKEDTSWFVKMAMTHSDFNDFTKNRYSVCAGIYADLDTALTCCENSLLRMDIPND